MLRLEIFDSPLTPPNGARKSWTVYQDLKRQILLGELTSRSPITEQALAAEYCCSQGTVREALLSLQEHGLVDRRGYQGTYVTQTSDEEALVLVRLRLNLECAGLERSTVLATPCEISRLREISSDYLDYRSRCDTFACAEIDRAFHLSIFSISDMPMLQPILKRTLLHLHRYTISRNRGHIMWDKFVGDPHNPIIDAIAEGDADTAKTLMSKHITLALSLFAPDLHDIFFEDPTTTHAITQLA